MKKVKAPNELRPGYKREDFGAGVRGKYLDEYRKGTNLDELGWDISNRTAGPKHTRT